MICSVHEIRPGDIDLYRNGLSLVLALLNAESAYGQPPRASRATILTEGAPRSTLYTCMSRFDVVCRA